MSTSAHTPVMLAEVVAALARKPGGIYVDGTFGGGGWSRAILAAGECTVWGLDRDAAAPAPPAEAAPDERSWWYLRDGARQGPVAFDLLRTLWRSGAVDGGTLVWTTGMPEWVSIQTLPDLESALDA